MVLNHNNPGSSLSATTYWGSKASSDSGAIPPGHSNGQRAIVSTRLVPIAYAHDTQRPCSLVLGRRQTML